MKLIKLSLVAVIMSVLFGALVSTASAGRLEFSIGSTRINFASLEFLMPGATTRCKVTLEGSFHSRTLAKVLGSLIGFVTRADLGPCASGTATILRETLPWHIRYSGFSNPLPNITSIFAHVIGVAWRVRESGGIACLARSVAAEPALITYARIPTLLAEISGRIRTGIECFGISGTFRSFLELVYRLNTVDSVLLTLI